MAIETKSKKGCPKCGSKEVSLVGRGCSTGEYVVIETLIYCDKCNVGFTELTNNYDDSCEIKEWTKWQ